MPDAVVSPSSVLLNSLMDPKVVCRQRSEVHCDGFRGYGYPFTCCVRHEKKPTEDSERTEREKGSNEEALTSIFLP